MNVDQINPNCTSQYIENPLGEIVNLMHRQVCTV